MNNRASFSVKTGLIAGMINPASAYCEQQGGKLNILNLPNCGGEVGICAFGDQSVCEEWDLYRGDCLPPLVTGPLLQ